jgi:riboflavin transporter FmnP
VNSREIALIIIFTALTMALDPVRVPSVYLFGVYYRFSEIPIAAASLLFGLKIGVPIAIMNVAVEIALFPTPASVIGVPFVLVLTLSMLLGIHTAFRFMKRRTSKITNRGTTTSVKYFTAFGTLFRTAPVPFVVGFLYRFMLPIVGFNPSDAVIVSLMPLFTLYALTFSLYTIPIGYLIAKTISKNLKVGNQL